MRVELLAMKGFEFWPQRVEAEIRPGAYIRGGVWIGDRCVVHHKCTLEGRLRIGHGESLTLEAWVKPGNAPGQEIYLIGKGRSHQPAFGKTNQNYALRVKRGANGLQVGFIFSSHDGTGAEFVLSEQRDRLSRGPALAYLRRVGALDVAECLGLAS